MHDANGYQLRSESGAVIAPEQPVTGISARDAAAYAAWRAGRDNLAWRLPTRLEWCATIQSGDERPFPWGMRFTNEVRLDKPVDQTPHGVRDLVSSVAELTAPEADAAMTWVCGGSHRDVRPEAFSDSNIRTFAVDEVDEVVGFRLALTVP
jgi:formylglycine-generating enzyme required for sulfatase activity